MELWKLDATDLARLIRLGKVSAREAVASCLARVDAVNPKLNAIVRRMDDEALARLPSVLASRPHFHGWVAFIDGEPAGIVNCFEGVSTFRAEPLLNIHDIAVAAKFRRRGVGAALLDAVEAGARALGCCKITLEVLEGNTSAIAAYLKTGFEPYELDPAMGRAMFFERKFY